MRRIVQFISLAIFFALISCASEKSELKGSLEEVEELHQKGVQFVKEERYDEANHYLQRSLEIVERVLGENHPDVAIRLNNLALLYRDNGRYAEAEKFYKMALGMSEKAPENRYPILADSLIGLATLYCYVGRYVDAEALCKRAIEIREKTVGQNHQEFAESLESLAFLYSLVGRYAEAELLLKRALEIREKVLGKEHVDVAQNLNNLALVYQSMGRYEEVALLYERSSKIIAKSFGKDHLNVAANLNNIAVFYQKTGKYEEAEPLYKSSLEISEKILGKNDARVSQTLHNMATLYLQVGRYEEAESLYRRSLRIREIVFGKDHPAIGKTLCNLANLYAYKNMQFDSHRMFTRGNAILDKEKENIFLLLSESQKLNYIAESSSIMHRFISHTAHYLHKTPQAVIDTFDGWLKWKGSVMEAQGRYINAFMYSENPEIQNKFGELNNTRREVARLQLSGPGKMNHEEYTRRLGELEKKKEVLEAELSRLSKDFAFEKMVGKADTKRISEILLKRGNNSVYIDFANIETFDFNEKKWEKSRYLAFVLVAGKEPVVELLDLSDTGEVDSHVKAYLDEVGRAKEFGEMPRERIVKAQAKAIYETVIKPIEPYIKGKKHLYISPDGNLNLIPFEVLMTPDGKYLMEDYTITYIAAGRDIMRFADETQARGEALIVADPDYDMGLQEKVQMAKALGVIETRGPAPLSRDAKDMRFKRLPETKQEADAIEAILTEKYKGNVRSYQDKKALEEVLFKTKEPRILHLATHGYFLKDEEAKRHPNLEFISQGREQMVDVGIENQMLRSGVVLAGANASLKEGRDDGVVSAEKILGLRLKGTDLVVLSACETGVGDVKSGEGVFGLKRSFILSGAKTVVMSLWSIPSKETTELMTDFYTLMAKGKTKAEALREARLNLMKKKPNPFYWGAFVMVGNPN